MRGSSLSIFCLATVFAIFAGACSLVEKQIKIDIPDAKWPGIFFKSIDSVTELSSLKRLRETQVPENDIETRIWRGFSTGPLEGVILKRQGGQWSALYVISDDCCVIRRTWTKVLPPPKSGWETFWKKIDEAGITSLPDVSKTGCTMGGIDGMGYVVEFNQSYSYRTYMYEVGYPSKCEEVKKMKQIGRIIAEEFYDGKQECVDARWLPCVAKYGVQNDL